MEIAIPMPNLIGRVQKRIFNTFAEGVEEWSALVTDLTRWEDDHLLDKPAPALLADHKATLERCIAFGRFLLLATKSPDFPDQQLFRMVAATQQTFLDKLRMWHGPRMDKSHSDRILAVCFPDEH